MLKALSGVGTPVFELYGSVESVVDGCHVMTTQSLGNVRDGLHPVQNFGGNLSRCTDQRPILRAIVLWQAHRHSCAVGHGRPHSRPLQFPDPFSMHLLGSTRQRTESANEGICFTSGTTATVVVNHRSEEVLLLHQCSMKIEISRLRWTC